MNYAAQYVQRRILENAVDRKKLQTLSLHRQKGLLVKLLYLKCSDTSGLEDAKDRPDEIVSLFPDRLAPLELEDVLGRLDEVLSHYLWHATYGVSIRPAIRAVQEIQTAIDRSIYRASKHATRGTRLEVKRSALKILIEIGLQIVEWCHISRPDFPRPSLGKLVYGLFDAGLRFFEQVRLG